MSLTVKKETGKIILIFDGAITIYEVSEYAKKLIEAFSEEESLEMDLSNVDECDTAGIQFVCSILKQENNVKSISIKGISKTFEDTSKVLGIDVEGLFKTKGVWHVENHYDC
jgi:anti-anti-sigma regulatory factor